MLYSPGSRLSKGPCDWSGGWPWPSVRQSKSHAINACCLDLVVFHAGGHVPTTARRAQGRRRRAAARARPVHAPQLGRFHNYGRTAAGAVASRRRRGADLRPGRSASGRDGHVPRSRAPPREREARGKEEGAGEEGGPREAQAPEELPVDEPPRASLQTGAALPVVGRALCGNQISGAPRHRRAVAPTQLTG